MSLHQTVLVADDDEDIVHLVAWALRDAGYDVVATTDGLEALRTTVRDRPDLLVLDLGMPALEGDQVLRILHARGDAPPIIFLTARASAEDRAEGLRMGAADYMIKPFDVTELVARVQNALRRQG
jgi:two-component system OmpR family response regulator